ncbi:MAG TPA: hypothetical protein VG317_04655 [Pseudonocardiaceae bacterium]|jgi:hypothetical protein|nr:hypothetical protein [Pseudonocardiaceae bacterium]
MAGLPAQSALPATVVAGHLRACAEELSRCSVTDLGEIAEVLGDLVVGQRRLSSSLARFAERLDEPGRVDLPRSVDKLDRAALIEVLDAASSAAGYSAEALAESGPLLDEMREFPDESTHS